jgi:FAD/FMN-containing dehydrogenase
VTARGIGRRFRRGEPGYHNALLGTLFNKREPNRFPEVIVQANGVEDVIGAIREALRLDLRVGICSGGHHWAANHLRDGGMLLDLSRLAQFTIDADELRALAGPGCSGSDLVAAALRAGAFFPAGHCRGVAIGGYLLQGGFGWNSRALGLACESVTGLDIVTADGDLVFADETQNADLFWAARGSGGGFFGVVVRYHLKLHPRPKYIGGAALVVHLDRLEEVYAWAHAAGREVAAEVELQILMTRRAGFINAPGLEVVAPVFADSARRARAAVAFLLDGPLRKRAAFTLPLLPTGLAPLYAGVSLHYPSERRWGVDNMWTNAPADDLVRAMRRFADTLPPAPSHTLWLNWRPPAARPDMAFSLEDQIYVAAYGAWKRPADDARYAHWARDTMAQFAHLSSGVQLADENLGERPMRFVSDAHLAKLDDIRRVRDPAGRFYAWLGRPAAANAPSTTLHT